MRNTLSSRKLLLTGLTLMFSITLHAQVIRQDIDVQQWPVGTVTLTTGDVLHGIVTYYRTQDIITVLKEDGTLRSLSPVNVEKFEVTNGDSYRWHTFRSIYWNQGKDYSDFKKPTFFEELIQGNATLLMRESYYKRTIEKYESDYEEGKTLDPMGYPIDAVFADQIKPVFFVLKPDGEIVNLQQVRKDFLRYCGKKSGIIKAFVRKNKLSFEQPHEFIAIVNYYSKL